jgi:hypothetical protein
VRREVWGVGCWVLGVMCRAWGSTCGMVFFSMTSWNSGAWGRFRGRIDGLGFRV